MASPPVFDRLADNCAYALDYENPETELFSNARGCRPAVEVQVNGILGIVDNGF